MEGRQALKLEPAGGLPVNYTFETLYFMYLFYFSVLFFLLRVLLK